MRLHDEHLWMTVIMFSTLTTSMNTFSATYTSMCKKISLSTPTYTHTWKYTQTYSSYTWPIHLSHIHTRLKSHRQTHASRHVEVSHDALNTQLYVMMHWTYMTGCRWPRRETDCSLKSRPASGEPAWCDRPWGLCRTAWSAEGSFTWIDVRLAFFSSLLVLSMKSVMPVWYTIFTGTIRFVFMEL